MSALAAPKTVVLAEAWPPAYLSVFSWRLNKLRQLKADPEFLAGAQAYYSDHPVEFINHWVDTYDPRRASKTADRPAQVPLVMFKRQDEFVRMLTELVDTGTNGLIEKCRDMGATWVSAAFSVWLWLYRPGAAVGWGSRKEQLVDRAGDLDSIFEKIRMIIRNLPKEFLPVGFVDTVHMTHMRILNPQNQATITGEAGDNIGRGGRKTIYFKDESAHYVRAEMIEAALGDNTNVQIDISSVNGLGNVFHRRREAGQEWQPGAAPTSERANVFVMRWEDHPEKTKAWYDARKKRFEEEGLGHIFAQEVDRSYDSSIESTVIKMEWVKAAIDADVVLGLGDAVYGSEFGALDVADEGMDKNAWARRNGIVLYALSEWHDRDPGNAARWALDQCGETPIDVGYDCIGAGAAVKSEINIQTDQDLIAKGVNFTKWNATAAALDPKQLLIPDDPTSPTNGELFENIKAQGWHRLGRRFYKTYQMVNGLHTWPVEDLIVVRSTAPLLATMMKELCQPVITKSRKTGRMVVNKTPDGTKSPNIGDAVMMCYHPIPEVVFDFAMA